MLKQARLIFLASILATVTLTASAEAAPRFAPSIDVTGKGPVPDLAGAIDHTGAHLINLGFVIAKNKRCSPHWGGETPVRDRRYAAQIAKVRAMKADVQVSFGGAGGVDLARVCTSKGSLAKAYGAAIDAVHARYIDIDLEGKAADNAGARKRVVAALKAIGKRKGVRIVLTVAVDPVGGLGGPALDVIRRARRAGARIDVVNVMTMDYYDSVPKKADTLGAYAISAANLAVGQLNKARPRSGGWWGHLGITPMLGVNDDHKVFTLADARRVVDFAMSKRVAEIGFWSIDRDQPCPGGAVKLSESCSGVLQTPFAFTNTLDDIDNL
jgi:hypothetical protein